MRVLFNLECLLTAKSPFFCAMSILSAQYGANGLCFDRQMGKTTIKNDYGLQPQWHYCLAENLVLTHQRMKWGSLCASWRNYSWLREENFRSAKPNQNQKSQFLSEIFWFISCFENLCLIAPEVTECGYSSSRLIARADGWAAVAGFGWATGGDSTVYCFRHRLQPRSHGTRAWLVEQHLHFVRQADCIMLCKRRDCGSQLPKELRMRWF